MDLSKRILDKKRPTATLLSPVVIGHASLPIATLWLPVVITHEALPIAVLCVPVVIALSKRILVGQPINYERHYHPRQAGQQLDLT